MEGDDEFELEVGDRQAAADNKLNEGDNHLPLDEEHEKALVEDGCIFSESKGRHHDQDHHKSGDIDECIEGDSLHELCEDNYEEKSHLEALEVVAVETDLWSAPLHLFDVLFVDLLLLCKAFLV